MIGLGSCRDKIVSLSALSSDHWSFRPVHVCYWSQSMGPSEVKSRTISNFVHNQLLANFCSNRAQGFSLNQQTSHGSYQPQHVESEGQVQGERQSEQRIVQWLKAYRQRQVSLRLQNGRIREHNSLPRAFAQDTQLHKGAHEANYGLCAKALSSVAR